MTNKKSLWLSGPYLVWIAGFIILPLLVIAYYAFTKEGGGITLSNIIGAVKDPINLKATLYTVLLAGGATAICLLLAYPLAMFLTKLNMKNKASLIFLFILPMWMNFMLQMVAINVILEDEGIINGLFTAIGFEKMHIANTYTAVLIGMTYDYFPFMLLPIYNTVSKIDGDLINASYDLGAGKVKTFFKVLLPLSLPGIVSGITMVFIPAISDFAISDMLGGGNTLLIGNVVEMSFGRGLYHSGSGLALILMAFVLLSSLLTEGKSDEGGAFLP